MQRLSFIKFFNALFRSGSVRGLTFGVGTCAHPEFVPYFLLNLHLAMEDREGEFHSVLNEDSPVEGISVGKFLLLLFSIMIQDRLIVVGDWTFCFGLLIRHLIGPDGCFNVAAILSIREICFFAKLRKGSVYYLDAAKRLYGSGHTSVTELLKGESRAEMTALLNATRQAYDQRLPLQLFADAGVDPKTKKDEVISFVINLHRKPAGYTIPILHQTSHTTPMLPRPGIGSKTGLPRPTPAFPTPTNTQREAADGATTPAGPIIPSGPTPLFAGGVKQGGKNLVSDEPYRRIRALRRAEGQLTDQPTKLYDQRKDLIGRRRPTAICGVSEGGGQ